MELRLLIIDDRRWLGIPNFLSSPRVERATKPRAPTSNGKWLALQQVELLMSSHSSWYRVVFLDEASPKFSSSGTVSSNKKIFLMDIDQMMMSGLAVVIMISGGKVIRLWS